MDLPIRNIKWFINPSQDMIDDTLSLSATERIHRLMTIFRDIALPLTTRLSVVKLICMSNYTYAISEIHYLLTQTIHNSRYTMSQKFEIVDEFLAVSNSILSIHMKTSLLYRCTKLYWELWKKPISLHHKKKCLSYLLKHREEFFWESFVNDITNTVPILPVEDLTDWIDILINCNHQELVQFGYTLIGHIHEEKRDRTVYEDRENVHDHHIQTSLKQALTKLEQDDVTDTPDFIEDIKQKFILLELPLTNIIENSFTRIIEDTTPFGKLTLHGILQRIWKRIKNHPHNDQLIRRLHQELNDMYDKCSSGHMARLISVLDTYDFHISISLESQLLANIKARIHSSIQKMNDEEYRSELLNSMIGDKREFRYYCEIYKSVLQNELKTEFVPTYFSSENFDTEFETKFYKLFF